MKYGFCVPGPAFDYLLSSFEAMKMTGRSALMDKAINHTQVNRAFTLSLEDNRHGRYQRLDQLDFPDETVTCIFLEQVSFPLYLFGQFGTEASDTVYRRRLRVKCVFPLTQLNTSLLANDRPAANCMEAAPWILYRAGVERIMHQEDLLCAQDPLVSLCPPTDLDALCQLDPVRLAASTA